MRRLASLVLLAAVGACAPDATPTLDYRAVFDGSGGRWIDLTHAFSESTIYWPTDAAGFQLDELAFGPTEGGWFYASYRFASAEHGGTHLDAPIHFAEGRLTADQIPLSALMGPAAVIDVTPRVTPDYLVSVDDLKSWEAMHGDIPAGAILLIRTGWASRWSDRTAYLGTDLTGEAAVAELHFSRHRRGGGPVARGQPRHLRRWHRHTQYRPRPVSGLPRSRRLLRREHRRVRERGRSKRVTRHRELRDRSPHEDRGRQRRTVAHRRVRAGQPWFVSGTGSGPVLLIPPQLRTGRSQVRILQSAPSASAPGERFTRELWRDCAGCMWLAVAPEEARRAGRTILLNELRGSSERYLDASSTGRSCGADRANPAVSADNSASVASTVASRSRSRS